LEGKIWAAAWQSGRFAVLIGLSKMRGATGEIASREM